MIIKVEDTEINGNMYRLLKAYEDEGDKYPAQLGKKKCGLFVGALPQISEWVEANDGGDPRTEMEVKDPAFAESRFPFMLKLGNAKKLLQAVPEIAAFAAEA